MRPNVKFVSPICDLISERKNRGNFFIRKKTIPGGHSDSAGGQFRPKKIVPKPNFFIKTWQNRVFEVQMSNCLVIFRTKNFHTWKMKKMLPKKEKKYEKYDNANFSRFLSAGVKIEFKIAKNRSHWYFTWKNMKFSFIKSAQKMTFLAQKIRFFCITFETYATVRFGSSAGLVWCLKYIFGMTKKRFSHGESQANS